MINAKSAHMIISMILINLGVVPFEVLSYIFNFIDVTAFLNLL